MPTHPVQDLVTAAGAFVIKQKGVWEHADWEGFMAKVQKLGLPLDDEGKRNLGNLLEASKHFYNVLPVASASKKAAASTAKPKAKAKAKPQSKKA